MNADTAPDIRDLHFERAMARRAIRLLARHPDCRDPDHPGCVRCQPAAQGDTPETCLGCDDLDKVAA